MLLVQKPDSKRRWFGYRRGYELLPRIWMSDKAQRQFDFLSEMDQELRDEIKQMSETGVNFAEVGPKIMNSPKANLIRIVTANRMRAAVTADFDFSGHTTETAVFDNDSAKLRANLNRTTEFINSLGTPDQVAHINKHNTVWRNVGLSKITTYLKDYKFSARIKGLNDIEPLIKWLEKFTNDGIIGKWNVILAGNRTRERVWKPVEGISVNLINRAQRYERNGNVLNISTLRSPDDFLSDVPANMSISKKCLILRKLMTYAEKWDYHQLHNLLYTSSIKIPRHNQAVDSHWKLVKILLHSALIFQESEVVA